MSKIKRSKRILVSGTLPPPLGGATVSFNFLAKAAEANKHHDCDIFDF